MAKPSAPKLCFVISPIGAAGSDIRQRCDKVLRHVIRPAVEAAGYQAVRADEISEPGIITAQVIQHLVDAPLVIADLTGHNPNVFYELAVRHMLRKPAIQLIESDEVIPFDVAGARTIPLNHRDLDSVAECQAEIGRQIHAAEANPDDIETPISISADLWSLRQSKNPLENSVAEIIASLHTLDYAVRKLEQSSLPHTDMQVISAEQANTILSDFVAIFRRWQNDMPPELSRAFQDALQNAILMLLRDTVRVDAPP